MSKKNQYNRKDKILGKDLNKSPKLKSDGTPAKIGRTKTHSPEFIMRQAYPKVRGFVSAKPNIVDTEASRKKYLQSKRGTYNMEFIRSFKDMTEMDIDLRIDYAKDLLHKLLNVHEDFIQFEMKKGSGKSGITTRYEVFYVSVGKEVVGKMSIATQRAFLTNTLTFVYQSRRHTSKR